MAWIAHSGVVTGSRNFVLEPDARLMLQVDLPIGVMTEVGGTSLGVALLFHCCRSRPVGFLLADRT
jgi:hypothetical protein